MIYHYTINGIDVQTGDIICTSDGKPDILPGQFWRMIGRLLPGDVDHVVIYLGPEGRCVEAGGRGVATFEIENGRWECDHLILERGLLVDSFYGVAYPLEGLGLSPFEEEHIRENVAAYCLAQLGKPYNLNFLDAEREDAFYCSQLAYKAYQRHGVNLNTGMAMGNLPGSDEIVYPQEIWDGFPHQRGECLDQA
ncbi:MAG: YiiX/YebB-like N1pC/P60 family cysteine hydrolase [Chloroflexota bacterium]